MRAVGFADHTAGIPELVQPAPAGPRFDLDVDAIRANAPLISPMSAVDDGGVQRHSRVASP
jgi:hypothetical protein